MRAMDPPHHPGPPLPGGEEGERQTAGRVFLFPLSPSGREG
jgi:hypothetical protein